MFHWQCIEHLVSLIHQLLCSCCVSRISQREKAVSKLVPDQFRKAPRVVVKTAELVVPEVEIGCGYTLAVQHLTEIQLYRGRCEILSVGSKLRDFEFTSCIGRQSSSTLQRVGAGILLECDNFAVELRM